MVPWPRAGYNGRQHMPPEKRHETQVDEAEARVDEMLDTNLGQRAYYERANGSSVSKENGWATNAWRRVRARALSAVPADANDLVYARHRDWCGSLGGLKVLELGCGRGTPLSRFLLDSSREYHAIDLSASSVSALSEKLGGNARATFHVGDFLDRAFAERNFDLVYAHSVLHHFRYLEAALDRLDSILAPGGRVITLDPTQTWLPARMARAAYRPFQTDRDWEFPFNSREIELLRTRYTVLDRLGMFGRLKWAMVVGAVAPRIGMRLGTRWFEDDFSPAAPSASHIGGCLRVSFHLARR